METWRFCLRTTWQWGRWPGAVLGEVGRAQNVAQASRVVERRERAGVRRMPGPKDLWQFGLVRGQWPVVRGHWPKMAAPASTPRQKPRIARMNTDHFIRAHR